MASGTIVLCRGYPVCLYGFVWWGMKMYRLAQRFFCGCGLVSQNQRPRTLVFKTIELRAWAQLEKKQHIGLPEWTKS
jgi:hypothetical protein